jgi:hypothetical protein
MFSQDQRRARADAMADKAEAFVASRNLNPEA